MPLTDPAFLLEISQSSIFFEGVNVNAQGFISEASSRNLDRLEAPGVDGARFRVRNSVPRPFNVTTSIPISTLQSPNNDPFVDTEEDLANAVGRLAKLTLDKPDRFVAEVIVLDIRIVQRGDRSVAAGVPASFDKTIVATFSMQVV